MKIVLLCGGYGTRLREETDIKPKPMVEVGGVPILMHLMKFYMSYGYNDFILCLGYKANVIKDYFCNLEYYQNDFTIDFTGSNKAIHVHPNNQLIKPFKVTLVDTGKSNLKGSRLKQVEKYIEDDTFMLTYGDGLSDVNIDALLDCHHSQKNRVTLTGVQVESTSRFGELNILEDKVVSFKEKPKTRSSFISGGFFVMNKAIFSYLNEDPSCDLEYGALEKIAEEGHLGIYKHDGRWACMDTARDRDSLNELIKSNSAFWMQKEVFV